jgi:PAS domain S-box-containing protein
MMTPEADFLWRKALSTSIAVGVILIAAVGVDYISNTFVFGTPHAFTPINTALIALLVGTPISYFLVGQRLDMQRVKDQLVESVGQKERAVLEVQLRRDEAEAARAAAEHALEQLRVSDKLYRLLADNQTDLISLWSADGRRIYCSPSIERTFGYTSAELLAMSGLGNAHPDDAPIIRDVFNAMAPGAGPRDAQFRMLHKDGSEVWVEGTLQRLNDGSDGLLSTTRIITARKKMEHELISALDDAKAALAVKSDFLANMTHELRTPLNAIIGFSGIMRQSAALNAADSHQVGLIWDASQTLLHVVNDVLDFSKLEAGAVEFELHPFDPTELAKSAVALLADKASSKGLTLSTTVIGPGGLLLGDVARLRQVLINFISNAVKFTTRGDIHLRIIQSAAGDRRNLRIEVKDSGIGVPPAQMDHIFGRFTQADASVSRQYGGTGLGLAISKRIIDALDGEIGVDSNMGEGSTFWFEVSMPPAGAIDSDPTVNQPPVSIDRTLRLLVVDDNAVNTELVCALLSPFDFIIDTAGDGVEAVESVSLARYDLILMDVQMPNMDGITATRHIRAAAHPDSQRVPIIAMTANVLPEQVARCLDAGMDDHLGKPISPHKLLEAIDRWTSSPLDEDAESASDRMHAH